MYLQSKSENTKKWIDYNIISIFVSQKSGCIKLVSQINKCECLFLHTKTFASQVEQ